MVTKKIALWLVVLGICTCSLQGMDNDVDWLIPQAGNFDVIDGQQDNLDDAFEEAAPLIDAVKQGFNAVREFLDRGGDVNAGEGVGLYEAVRRGDYETARLLINRGINMAMVGTSALEIAVEHGHAKLIPLLVRHGAEIEPAREVAQADGRHDMVELLNRVELLNQYDIEPILPANF